MSLVIPRRRFPTAVDGAQQESTLSFARGASPVRSQGPSRPSRGSCRAWHAWILDSMRAEAGGSRSEWLVSEQDLANLPGLIAPTPSLRGLPRAPHMLSVTGWVFGMR
ncbi:hypothetical protein FALCPG4_002977 [Fusarium falciforme]